MTSCTRCRRETPGPGLCAICAKADTEDLSPCNVYEEAAIAYAEAVADRCDLVREVSGRPVERWPESWGRRYIEANERADRELRRFLAARRVT